MNESLLVCDICGGRSVVSVVDYTEDIECGRVVNNPVEPVKRFCEVHKRDSECMGKFTGFIPLGKMETCLTIDL
jgi:hypothetical protein